MESFLSNNSRIQMQQDSLHGIGKRLSIRKLIDIAFNCMKKEDFEKAIKIFDLISNYFLINGKQNIYLIFKAHKIECYAKLLKKRKQFDLYEEKMREAESIWRYLGNDKNANWCRANIESHLATQYFKHKNYAEAMIHYNKASEIFSNIGLENQAKFNKACFLLAEACTFKNTDPKKATSLADEASKIFQEGGFQKESLRAKADSFFYHALANFREGKFQEAKTDFLKAAEVSEKLGLEKDNFYYRAYAFQCDYRIAKLNRDVEAAIEALQEASSLFYRAGAKEAYFATMGDLLRLKGLKKKSEGNYEEAIKYFQEAQDNYRKAVEVSKHHKSKHELSAEYMEALVLSTKADYAFVFSQHLEEACRLYLESSEKYKKLGDESSASFCTNVGLLLKAYMNKEWERVARICENLHQYYEEKGSTTPLSIVHNIVKMVSMMIARRQEEIMREIYEEDRGYMFEAYVRELISKFDGRRIPGQLIGLKSDEIILHRYEEVKRGYFEPEDDEVGIVFNDKSIIEIDVLAERIERERRYILVGECKCTRKPITTSDLELLERKAKFLELRYNKIARLENKPRPIIEEKWFITTSHFEDKCFEYAKQHNIKLIDLEKLNNLLKEFGMKRLKGY